MGRSIVRRSARWPSPKQVPTSCGSGWASSASAATSSPVTASTSPRTRARRGRTWASRSPTRSRGSASTRRIPHIVFVADFGKYSVPSDERGVFKSTDGGKTWRKVLFRDNKTGAVDIAIDPHNPNVMFAALWEAFRVEYSMSSGGPGSGLFKSTDGGEHWTEITHNPGLPTGLDGKIGVAVSGADSTRIYAIVENQNGGLYSSDDAGTSWKLINDGRNIR